MKTYQTFLLGCAVIAPAFLIAGTAQAQVGGVAISDPETVILTAKALDAANQTIGTFSLYVGPGFEYFMPFLRSASVEGSVRLRVSSTQSKSDQGSQAAQSSSAIDISGNGFSPMNLSLHYYF